ncbi:hypothetical protein EG341_16430 [Chryseobacterium lactis]|nr:hypothetical protein [Chryseobacterium lactis]AZA80453.1 hypothetical protein EG342_00305 [Chryseobacterium lactis]AZB05455.1 hypothetical protein EG341_16430 [Chryseobacterium lactis]
MKTQFLFVIIFLIGGMISAQDSLRTEEIQSKIITFNPKSIPENTNGINLGVMDDYQSKKINGINLQGNPLSIIYLLIPKPIEIPSDESATVSINGLHISTGGITDGKQLNGVGISMYHIAQVTNGVTINGFNNNSGKLNGVHVSFLNNSADTGNGLLISLSNSTGSYNGAQLGIHNKSDVLKGMQIGGINIAKENNGLQIGVINKTEKTKGFQIGFWNKNAKRSLPLVNF